MIGTPLPLPPSPSDPHSCVYLDYNATTPVFPEVADAMEPFLRYHFGNPSSGHVIGRACRAGVDLARRRVATMIGAADPDEVTFTSCGTESNNTVLRSVIAWGRGRNAAAGRGGTGGIDNEEEDGQSSKDGQSPPSPASSSSLLGLGRPPARVAPHVVTTVIEHPAVLACLDAMAANGECSITKVPVDGRGVVALADIEAALTEATVLVSVMHSNNEVGSVQPIRAIADMLRQYKRTGGRAGGDILLHSDAAQSIGKVPVDVDALGVDFLTVVGHKFGAPKGVACLYRRGTCPRHLTPLLVGGGQEAGRRAGTENVLLLVGLGRAAQIVTDELHATMAHMAAMRARLLALLQQGLQEMGGKCLVNGPEHGGAAEHGAGWESGGAPSSSSSSSVAPPPRALPNTLSISIRGVNGGRVLAELTESVAASAAAACHSGAAAAAAVSSVIQALHVPADFASGTLRLSTGRHTTLDDIETGAASILAVLRRHLDPAP